MIFSPETYYVWIGGSCDYAHPERAGAAAYIVEREARVVQEDSIADLHTTEFRMMLTAMIRVMTDLPQDSKICFLTNAAYVSNFDKPPSPKSANPDLILACIEAKKRHASVGVRVVAYHKNQQLIKTHDMATAAMRSHAASAKLH